MSAPSGRLAWSVAGGVAVVLCGLLAVASSRAVHADDGPAVAGRLLIRNARLVDGTDAPPRDRVSIRIADGRVAAIGTDLDAADAPVLDAGGATVLPGLFDAHVHLSSVPGGDLRGDPPDVRRRLVAWHLRAYLACGITTVLDAGIATEDALEIERWLAAGNPGPRFLTLGPGFFTPGGFLSPPLPGVTSVADVVRVFDLIGSAHGIGAGVLLEHGWAGVPRWPVHSPEIRAAIVRQAAARGLPIYVHATSEEDQTIALDMGAHALLQSFEYRREEASEAFVARMAQTGTYQMTGFAGTDALATAFHLERLDDPLVRFVVPPVELATARDPEVPHTMARAMVANAFPWLPGFLRESVSRTVLSETSARFGLAASQREVRRLHAAGVPIVIGTEVSGGPYDQHGPTTLREVELLGEAGLTPAAAIAAATRVPAEMLGLTADLGTVEVGKRADLVIVRDDPLADLRALHTVRWTVQDGVAHTPAEWMGVDVPYEPGPAAPPASHRVGLSSSALGADPILVAAAFAFVALLWALITTQVWRNFRRGPRIGSLSWIPPLVCAMATVHYLLPVLTSLAADDLIGRAPGVLILLSRLGALMFVVNIPLLRHHLLLASPREAVPSRTWLAANYGLAVLVAAAVAAPHLVPAPTAEMRQLAAAVFHIGYLLVMGFLVLRQLRRLARPGAWRPGGLGDFRSADLAILLGGLVAGAALLFLVVTGGGLSVWSVVLDVGVGLLLVAPFAVRMLGEMVRGLLLVGTAVGVTAAVRYGVPMLTARLESPALRDIVDLAAVVGLALSLLAVQPVLGGWIDRVVFRRTRRRQATLQAFLHALAPELGTHECCRRAVAEVARVMRLRGAAIALGDGEVFAAGGIVRDTVVRAWPRGDPAGALPATALVGWYELRVLPPRLRDALTEIDVVGIIPIESPRRRWGHLLVSTGFLAATFPEEDVQVAAAFADQLALILDGAELLARAIAVERTLAHREKLAAIGELAARVAHEIRNPVTAARSLAQQLARGLTTGDDAEAAALILGELERVERQVAALLRFSRRDELQFEPVELGTLARVTIDDLRSRLDAAGIGVEVAVTEPVTVRADAEKIRQVLINLVENAIDALAEGTERPRLSVVVGRQNGSAAVRVIDNGPGVPGDALAHLFEPFFSRKVKGTGLGLAIAKRTVDAHGGRIAAAAPPGGGMTFEVELPLA
jgi:signal transduction histidine kinase/imidazolonepropionase-like amidohydrolase